MIMIIMLGLFVTFFWERKKEELAKLTTLSASEINASSAKSGGNISNDGGWEISSRGVVWATHETPSIEQHLGITTDGSGSGLFTSNIMNLSHGTTYYVRAYAVNGAGTAYGNQVSFTTSASLPTVTTSNSTEITTNSAKIRGNVTDDGGGSVTARGIAYTTSQNPTTADNTVTAGSGTGSFTTDLSGLSPGATYYVRAFATNSAGTAYGNQVTFSTINPPVANFAGSPTSGMSPLAVSFTDQSTNNPTSWSWSFGDGTTSTQRNPSKTYNNPGTYTVNLTVSSSHGADTHTKNNYITVTQAGSGGWPRDTQTQVVDVTNPATGKTWMDRNLGASRAATSSTDAEAYGDMYQWGRAADGHQKRNSGTTSTLSSSNTPGHGNFILAPNRPWDWRSPQNTNLWQGVNGVNNPCPQGYRLPTEAELNAERQSWSSNNSAGAFASPLKLPVAGYRIDSHGSLNSVGSRGYYWSSTFSSNYSRYLYFRSNTARMYGLSRAYGFSVRCIKD